MTSQHDHDKPRSAIISCVDHNAAHPAHRNQQDSHPDGDKHKVDIITIPGPDRLDPQHPQSRKVARRSLAHIIDAAKTVYNADGHKVRRFFFTSHRGCAANPATPLEQDRSTQRAARRVEDALHAQGLTDARVYPQVAIPLGDEYIIGTLPRITKNSSPKRQRKSRANPS